MSKPHALVVLVLAALLAGCSPTVAEHATPPEFAPAQAEQGAQDPVSQGSDELVSERKSVSGVGYLQVPEHHIRKVGSPPTIELCLEQSESPGLIANSYSCTRWVPLTTYLDEFFPDSRAELTRWEFQCLASGGRFTTCDRVLILYYQVP